MWRKVKNSSLSENSEIVFFDGVCNLCNGFVDFVIRRNSDLKFASLQGKKAAQSLPTEMMRNLPSVVFQSEGRIFTESTAALKILGRLGGLWPLLKIGILIPKLLR